MTYEHVLELKLERLIDALSSNISATISINIKSDFRSLVMALPSHFAFASITPLSAPSKSNKAKIKIRNKKPKTIKGNTFSLVELRCYFRLEGRKFLISFFRSPLAEPLKVITEIIWDFYRFFAVLFWHDLWSDPFTFTFGNLFFITSRSLFSCNLKTSLR